MPAFQYQHGDRPLDGYTIQNGLGRGGFGEVYFALSDSGRQVALKILQNYEEVELRGISHCMNLKSPHLVSIFDVRQNSEGKYFVIMEYVDGPSLRDIMDQTPQGLGATKTAFFLRELAKGLSYLHEAEVVHRDLKPHNVFYEDGFVKIGDYSLSKLISASHRSGHTMTVGTVHYMAPEISMGRYDARVDIYALGVMLHEMLTGEPPFVGESMGEILMKHMTATPDLKGIEEPFASTIKRALEKEPNDRFQSVAEMVESVYGVDHINNSVTAFNPTELSLVAERVAQKAGIGTGKPAGGQKATSFQSGDNIMSDSELAATDLHETPGKPNWETSAIHAPEVYESNPVYQANAGVPSIVQDDDPISLGLRVTVALCVMAFIAVLPAFTVARLGFGLDYLQLLMPMILVSFGMAYEGQYLVGKLQPFGQRWAIFLTAVGCCVVGLMAGAAFDVAFFRETTSALVLSVGLVSAFDWMALTSVHRKKRLSLGITMISLLIGLVVASAWAANPTAVAGCVAGIALATQLLSPCHTVSFRSNRRLQKSSESPRQADSKNKRRTISELPGVALPNSDELKPWKLNLVGHLFLMSAAIVPLAVSVFIVMVLSGSIPGIGPFVLEAVEQYSPWPAAMQLNTTFAMLPLIGIGIGILLYTRQFQSLRRRVHCIVAGAILFVANWLTFAGIASISWYRIVNAHNSQQPQYQPLPSIVLFSSNWIPCCFVAVGMILVAGLVLIWPEKNNVNQVVEGGQQ